MENEAQKKAISHIYGPMLILAGAGSGKTRVVTQRIYHLLNQGIPEYQILAVTFTNKAAKEMRTRVEKLSQKCVLTCTFHSLGARILRENISVLGYENNFIIFDEEDSLKLLKRCLKDLSIKENVKQIKEQISKAKNALVDENNIQSLQYDDTFLKVYPLYQKKLKESNSVDFDDLIFLPIKIFKDTELKTQYQKRWKFILVDEFQDTNAAQYSFITTLSKHKNIFVVGDPDQSIYSWRGARYQNVYDFKKDFKEVISVTLEQNYRSTKNILSAANSLIQKNNAREEKNLWSNLGNGEKIEIHEAMDEKEEAFFVTKKLKAHLKNTSFNDIAIFYRTNAQSRVLEDSLIHHKIPYVIFGGLSFYQRKEVKDILSFLKMLLSDHDIISFIRSVNIPKRGIGNSSISKLLQFSKEQNLPIIPFCANHSSKILRKAQQKGMEDYLNIIFSLRKILEEKPLYQVMQILIEEINYYAFLEEEFENHQERKQNIEELVHKAKNYQGPLLSFLEETSLFSQQEHDIHNSVKLMTLHNSKGLEFDVVFMTGMEEELFPHINSFNNIEEERRLCYVGMTRAKKYLYMSFASSRYIYREERINIPSRFLRELDKKFIFYNSGNFGNIHAF